MDDARDRSGDQRWDELVADLEAQARAHESVEDRAQALDHLRSARAGISLADRLRAALEAPAGQQVVLAVRGAGPVRGTVTGVGPTWVLLGDGARESVVLLDAVLSVTGLPAGAANGSAVEQRWGLGHVLRRHSRDRAAVRLVLGTGDVLTGTIDVVGSDHLELAEHPVGEARRADSVRAHRLVPFGALAVVSREGEPSPR